MDSSADIIMNLRSYYNYLFYYKGVGRFRSFDQWFDTFSTQRCDLFDWYQLDLALTECIDSNLGYHTLLAVQKDTIHFYTYREWLGRVITCVFQLFRVRKQKIDGNK